MEISLVWPIHTKENIKGYMLPGGEIRPESEEGKFVIMNIYGSRAISLLFCAHQTTESK